MNPGPSDSETRELLSLSCHRASWSHLLPLASGLWKGSSSDVSLRGDVVLGEGQGLLTAMVILVKSCPGLLGCPP